MRSHAKVVRIAYGILISYVGLIYITGIIGPRSPYNRFMENAVQFCVMSLFVVLPIAGLTLFLLNRKCRQEHTKSQLVLMGAVRFILVVAWLIYCVPVVITQPWPLGVTGRPRALMRLNAPVFQCCRRRDVDDSVLLLCGKP